MTDFFPIETPYNSEDYKIMKDAINMGIDSHLEGFTKSEFKKSPYFNNKFLFNIHNSELPILYRRLAELSEKTGNTDYQDLSDEIQNTATSYVKEMVNPFDPMDANQTANGEPAGNSDLNADGIDSSPAYPTTPRETSNNIEDFIDDDTKEQELTSEINISEAELKEMIKNQLSSLSSENSSDSLVIKHGENLKPLDETTDQERYEQVVFMQGEEADEVMDILNNDGKDAAMNFLMQWHEPGNHMGSNEIGAGTQDKTYEKDGYIMNWNPYLPYIGLTYDTEFGQEAPMGENHSIEADRKIDASQLNFLKKLYNNTPTEKIKNMISDLEGKLKSTNEPIQLKEEESTRIKTLKDFATKYNIVPTGITGKFSVSDFNVASANFTKDDAFDFAMILANIYLKRKIGLSWDDLGDTNSLWDYIEEGMDASSLFSAAQDAAKERLSNEGGGFDLDEDSQMKRHLAGQRDKNISLGQHAPNSQSTKK